jgi:hypothetical protein
VFQQLKSLKSLQIIQNIDYIWTMFLLDWVPMDWFSQVTQVLADFYMSFILAGEFHNVALKCFTHFCYDQQNVQSAT